MASAAESQMESVVLEEDIDENYEPTEDGARSTRVCARKLPYTVTAAPRRARLRCWRTRSARPTRGSRSGPCGGGAMWRCAVRRARRGD